MESGYKCLAALVIIKALHDLKSKKPIERLNARWFFQNNKYEFWADICRINYRDIRAKYQKILLEEEKRMTEETRVRMGAKQTAKGLLQLDLTAEAPTVEKAEELLGQALDSLVKTVKEKGFELVKA